MIESLSNMSSWLQQTLFGLSDETLDKIGVFNRIKLFENARRSDLISMAEKSEFQSMESGDRIIEKGEPGSGVFMIDSGEVAVKVDDDTDPVAHFEAGEYFGEMALIENAARSAHVDCSQSGRLLQLKKQGFFEILQGDPKTAAKFLYVLSRTLSRRLREMNEQMDK